MHNQKALERGAAYSVKYPNTFWITAQDSTGQPLQFSGVRINDWYGLTAAHGFRYQDQVYSNHTIGTGSNLLTDKGRTFGVSRVWIHPDWTREVEGNSVDLAIVRFDSPWRGEEVAIGSAAEGDRLTCIGFGLPATSLDGELPYDGERRAFQFPFEGYGSTLGALGRSILDLGDGYLRGRYYPFGYSGHLPLGGLAGPGCSGAGVWNQNGEVVGVCSIVPFFPLDFASMYAQRLDVHADWINSIAFSTPAQERTQMRAPLPTRNVGYADPQNESRRNRADRQGRSPQPPRCLSGHIENNHGHRGLWWSMVPFAVITILLLSRSLMPIKAS
ncbi:MAG: trypsin-like peptidase domain-containing protein [Phycisphaerales bacterium JB065]